MRRIRKILAWIVILLLVLIVAVFILIATFDWNRLKPTINDKVSQAIGRSFAINGDLSVHWQREPTDTGLAAYVPWPEFVARDIRVANPTWAKQPWFAQLDALRFRLSPLPLLAHRIVIPTLQLVHPVIDLERDKQSRATWTFTLPPSTEPSPWKLELGAIGFDRGNIALDDVISRATLQIGIEPLQQAIPYDQIVAQQSSDARNQASKTVGAGAQKTLAATKKGDASNTAPASGTAYQFSWKASGNYQGLPLQGSGKTGGVLAVQETDRPFPIQADVHIGDSHIALVGTLTDPVHLAALDVQLWFSGTSMAKLYALTGVTLPDTPPYATEGHLKAELHSNGSDFSYQNFRGKVGGSDIGGNLDFTTTAPRPKLTGTLKSQLLQFADLAPLIGADSSTEKQQRGDTTPQPADKVLPVEPFRTERWKAMDADVTFSAARIVREKELPIDALNVHLVMNNGVLQLDPLSLGLAGGTITSAIHLDGSRQPMQGSLKLSARHLKLKQLFPTFQAMSTSLGEINGDAALQTHGNSVAALLGNASGEIKLLMNDGAISKTLLETAGLNIGNVVIGKLFGDKTEKINCAASDLTANNGLFKTQLFVFDTEDAVINVEGTVNFASEQLNLDVKPHSKGIRLFSLRSPLYIKGTFKHPDIGVYTGTMLLRGGAMVALAVFATPAAALLPLIVTSHNSAPNTCQTVLEQMRAPSKATPIPSKPD